MDFPTNSLASTTPLFISSLSRYCGGQQCNKQTVRTHASITWPSANLGIYMPVFLPFHYNVQRVFWGNGSSTTGTRCFGIYTFDGAQIYTTTATAGSGASAIQYVTPSPDFILAPGHYYFAISFSGTTNVAWGSLPGAADTKTSGFLQQSSVSTLPASATFASNANPAWPFCGITKTSSGF